MIPEIPEIEHKIQNISNSIRKILSEMFPIRSQRQERGQEYMSGDKKEAKVRLNQLRKKPDILGESNWEILRMYMYSI